VNRLWFNETGKKRLVGIRLCVITKNAWTFFQEFSNRPLRDQKSDANPSGRLSFAFKGCFWQTLLSMFGTVGVTESDHHRLYAYNQSVVGLNSQVAEETIKTMVRKRSPFDAAGVVIRLTALETVIDESDYRLHHGNVNPICHLPKTGLSRNHRLVITPASVDSALVRDQRTVRLRR